MSKFKAASAETDKPTAPAPTSSKPAPIQREPIRDAVQSIGILPTCRPSPTFSLFVNPNRWMVAADGSIIPDFRKLDRSPGISGVAEVGRAGARSIDISEGRNSLMNKGYRHVPDSFWPGNVCQAYQVKGGVAHLLPWEVPVNGLPRITVDYDVQAAFVAKLRAEGFIGEPLSELVEALDAQLLELEERYRQRWEQSKDGKARRAAEQIAKRRAKVAALQTEVSDGE